MRSLRVLLLLPRKHYQSKGWLLLQKVLLLLQKSGLISHPGWLIPRRGWQHSQKGCWQISQRGCWQDLTKGWRRFCLNEQKEFPPVVFWKVGRVTECAGLEIRYTHYGYRGFESLTFRWIWKGFCPSFFAFLRLKWLIFKRLRFYFFWLVYMLREIEINQEI